MKLLLGPGRWDGGKEGEGDFAKGAGLDEKQISCFEPLLTYQRDQSEISVAIATEDALKPIFVKVRRDENRVPVSPSPAAQKCIDQFGWENASALGYLSSMYDRIENAFPESASIFATGGVGHQAYSELSQIAALAQSAGYCQDRIQVAIDPSVVRGLEYYTGPVFEAELLAEIPNEDGQIVRFGSVGGGGRYDGLVSRFRGEPVPATGFSIGVSRLMTALKNLGKLDSADVIAPVVVLVMDRDTDSLGRYQKMVAELRAAGIRSEMYLGGAGMKAQLKYADRRGCPVAIIQGGDERAKGELQIKDLIEGARMSAEISDNAEWRAARPAQVTVAEGELVAEVRKILAAQAEERARGK